MKILYSGIEDLLTLTGASRQAGRKVTPESLTSIRKAAILVGETGLIEWVGPRSQAPADFAEEIGLDAELVLPAFIESHTHSLFAGERVKEF